MPTGKKLTDIEKGVFYSHSSTLNYIYLT